MWMENSSQRSTLLASIFVLKYNLIPSPIFVEKSPKFISGHSAKWK